MQLLTPNDINDRVFINIYGGDKSGKTDFGLGMPGKLSFLNWDRELDKRAKHRMQDGKPIEHAQFVPYERTFAEWIMEEDASLKKLRDKNKNEFYAQLGKLREVEANKKGYRAHLRDRNDAILKTFFDELDYACFKSDSPSIFMDGHANLWTAISLGTFGKASKIVPTDYGELRAIDLRITDTLERSGKDVVISCEEKEEYKANKATGEFTNSGNSRLRYRVKTNIYFWVTPGDSIEDKFHARIRNSAENATIWGMELHGEMINFELVKGLILG